MEIIEAATLEDIAQLTDLLTTLFTQEADFQPDRAKQERGLRMIIESPSSGRIFAAHDGEAIVGMVCLLFTPTNLLGAIRRLCPISRAGSTGRRNTSLKSIRRSLKS